MTDTKLPPDADGGAEFPELKAVLDELLRAAEGARPALPVSQWLSAPPGETAVPLSAIDGAGRILNGNSLSESTRENYRRALRRLRDWMLEDNLSDLDDQLLAQYLAQLFLDGASPSAASLTVAAVTFLTRHRGQAVPPGPCTKFVLAGYRRRAAHRGRGPVKPAAWADVAAAAKKAGDGSALGARDAALILTLYDAMLTASQARALRVCDVEFSLDDIARLRVPPRRGQAPSLRRLGPPTVQRLQEWLAWPHWGSEAPLFPRLNKAHIPVGHLSRMSISQIVKSRFEEIGCKGFSAQSLRAGGAASLAMEGASIEEIQAAGGWRSPTMPARYARPEDGAAARPRNGRKRTDK